MNPIFESRTRAAKPHDHRTRAPGKRRQFLTVERMEERTLLSATPIRIGSLGDSITDEYQFYAPYRTAAQNWVEILSALRPAQVTFGASSTTSRGETRNQGYAQDWARSGATAVGTDVAGAGTTLVNQYDGGDPSGARGLLNQQGGLSNIDVATLLIGGNDYQSTLTNVLNTIKNTTILPIDPTTGKSETIGEFAKQQIVDAFEKTVPSDITTGVTDALKAITANEPKFPIVLVSPPDLSFTPFVKSAAATVNGLAPGDGVYLTGAFKIAAYIVDGRLQDLASSYKKTDANLRFVNLDKDVINPFVTKDHGVIDGTAIDPDGAGPSYTDLFVGDGFHPGTVGQALLANAIVRQINTIPAFSHDKIKKLSDSEILAYAKEVQPVTTAKLTASSDSVAQGDPTTFTIQVSSFPNINSTTTSENFDVVPPTGPVDFIDAAQGGKLLGAANLVPTGSGPTYTGSTATLTTSSLSPGPHEIVAVYSGDTVYPAVSVASATVQVVPTDPVQASSPGNTRQSQRGVQIGQAQLNRWNNQLDRGARLQQVVRSIMSYLHSQTGSPIQQVAGPLEKATL
jgi:hypothetical protein